MITITSLVKKFGRFTAVDDVSFSLNPGESLALWGANGAGKTTIIRCVLGLLPFRGSITVAGFDIRRQGKAARRAIGYVPQELALYDDFRLPEALHFFGRLKRAPRDRVPVVLREVGLEQHRRKRIRELSGGMKQRMALAVALLADPPLLVLDELTANLDAGAQSGFMNLLRQLSERGKTILFTSHHLTEVESLAGRVLVMESGRVTSECGPSDLAASIGAKSLIKVFVAADTVERALDVLRAGGFTASRNGQGVIVEVPSAEKATPLQALGRAHIEVRNFDMLSGAGGELAPGGIIVD